jgi:hypothetical protein
VAAGPDGLAREVALAEHRVAGDDPAAQGQLGQQLQGGLVLVGLGVHGHLAQDAAGGLVRRRQQVDRRGVRGQAAAERLAVEGRGVQGLGVAVAQPMGDPSRQGGLEGRRVEPREEPLEGAEAGGPAAIAQLVHELDGLVAAPLGDGGVAAAAAEDGAAGLGEHGGQGVPLARGVAGVGDLGQEGHQRAGRVMGHRASRQRVGEGEASSGQPTAE